jgi:hypothetical protein
MNDTIQKRVTIRESRRGFLRRTRLYVVTTPAAPGLDDRPGRTSAYGEGPSSTKEYPGRQGGTRGEAAIVGSEDSGAVRRR